MPADACLGLLLWETTACDPHALGGTQCGEQHGPDLNLNTVQPNDTMCVVRLDIKTVFGVVDPVLIAEVLEKTGVFVWMIASLLEEMKDQSCVASFEFSGTSRCIKQESVEAPTLCTNLALFQCLSRNHGTFGEGLWLWEGRDTEYQLCSIQWTGNLWMVSGKQNGAGKDDGRTDRRAVFKRDGAEARTTLVLKGTRCDLVPLLASSNKSNTT